MVAAGPIANTYAATTDALRMRYPSLYTPESFVDVPAGWLELVLNLSAEVVALGLPNVRCVEVKQKLGELRWYASSTMHCAEAERGALAAVVVAHEQRSKSICEVCGAWGSLARLSGGMLRTLCWKHGGAQSGAVRLVGLT